MEGQSPDFAYFRNLATSNALGFRRLRAATAANPVLYDADPGAIADRMVAQGGSVLPTSETDVAGTRPRIPPLHW